jgi:acyl dehydratase
MMGLFLDELSPGQVFELGRYAFTNENIRRYQTQFAPLMFAGSEEAAVPGKEVAAGFHLCSAWMPCFIATNSAERARMAAKGRALPEIGPGFGLQNVRSERPVHAGDVVHYRTQIITCRELRSKPQWGLIEQLNTGHCNGQLVISFGSSMMVARR